MKNRLTLLVPFLFSFLIACEPWKVLIIKTARKKNVSIIIYARGSIFSHDQSDFENRIVFHISTDSVSKRKIILGNGRGYWEDKDITEYAGMIDSIILNNSNGRLALKDTSSIRAYLKQHKRSLTTIRIKAK